MQVAENEEASASSCLNVATALSLYLAIVHCRQVTKQTIVF